MQCKRCGEEIKYEVIGNNCSFCCVNKNCDFKISLRIGSSLTSNFVNQIALLWVEFEEMQKKIENEIVVKEDSLKVLKEIDELITNPPFFKKNIINEIRHIQNKSMIRDLFRKE